MLGQFHATSAERPQTGEYAEECGLAAAGGTLNCDLLALPNRKIDVVEQQRPVGQVDLHACHLELMGLRCACDELALGRRPLGCHHGLAEARETVDHRLPL